MSPSERLLWDEAEGILPLDAAIVERSRSGELMLQWQSPCDRIGALSLIIYAEQEILITSLISHTHVKRWLFEREVSLPDQIWPALVQAAVAETAGIMRGEIAFTETYDAEGRQHSSGLCPVKHLAESLQNMRRLFGEGMTERAFTWCGEIKIKG